MHARMQRRWAVIRAAVPVMTRYRVQGAAAESRWPLLFQSLAQDGTLTLSGRRGATLRRCPLRRRGACDGIHRPDAVGRHHCGRGRWCVTSLTPAAGRLLQAHRQLLTSCGPLLAGTEGGLLGCVVDRASDLFDSVPASSQHRSCGAWSPTADRRPGLPHSRTAAFA
jgi:hypothetical protein